MPPDSQPPLTLLQKQQLFAQLLGKLIEYVYSKGWALTLADGYRGDHHGHMPGSLHYSRLAQDINLFADGRYVTDSRAKEYTDIGAFWKSLHPLCSWGGDFKVIDGNHFSLRHSGRE